MFSLLHQLTKEFHLLSYKACVELLVAFSIISATDFGNPEAFKCPWIIAKRAVLGSLDFDGTSFALVVLTNLVSEATVEEVFGIGLGSLGTNSGWANMEQLGSFCTLGYRSVSWLPP